MRPKLGGAPLGANSANRDTGNVRKLYREYYAYFGDEERPNSFRKLYFKRLPGVEFPPFADDWVREKILKPGALDHMRQDAAYLLSSLSFSPKCGPKNHTRLALTMSSKSSKET